VVQAALSNIFQLQSIAFEVARALGKKRTRKEGSSVMNINRHLIMDSSNFKPIISRAVVHNDLVYLCGITADPIGDITAQTRQVLERIDALLEQAGTNKSKLLTAQVWLSDMRFFRQHNLAWNEWVDPKDPPARACVQAELFDPGLLVEIMVTAAK
jgi:enamine deaminase RidA (YjgF/YER057c/UK114 family)